MGPPPRPTRSRDFHGKTSSAGVLGADSAAAAPCRHAPGHHGCPAPSAPVRGHFLWCERRGEVYQPCQGPCSSPACLLTFLPLFTSLPLWGWLTVLPLLQISFWLLENGFSVLIAACDTFRAGAVEQLRTHTRRLSALHPPENHGGRTMVQLFEKGYGKDAAGIAMEAIAFGTVHRKRGASRSTLLRGFSWNLQRTRVYPTTNFLLSNSSELVMCHAMLRFGVTPVVAGKPHTFVLLPQYLVTFILLLGLPRCGSVVKNLPANAGDIRDVVPALGREDPLQEEMQPTPVPLPGKSHGQRSLAGSSPQGCRVRHG